MARNKKCRNVCFRPDSVFFEAGQGYSHVTLFLDELEALRLVDYENMEQENAATQIGVSRGTLQRMLYSARHKVTEALVQSKNIVISDNAVNISERTECNNAMFCGYCSYRDNIISENIKYRGENMLVAVTYENGLVYQHFGHTPAFVVYEIENNEIKNKIVLDTNGTGHGALAGFLENNQVDLLICGGIGGGAKQALESRGIKLLAGVAGNADDVVKAFINGTLQANSEANCNHHHHHAHGSSCGSHHDHHGSSCHCGDKK